MIRYYLLLFFTCILSSCSLFEVERKLNVEHSRVTNSFHLKRDKCLFAAKIYGLDEKQNYFLSLSRHKSNKCRSSYERSLRSYKVLLSSVFRTHDPKRLKGMTLGELSSLDLSYQLNNRVLVGAYNSGMWKEYSTNYPNHKNQFSSNYIYLQIIRELQLFSGLTGLFDKYEINLVVDSVEKVFSSRIRSLPFKFDLHNKLIKRNISYFYDAGTHYLKNTNWSVNE